jgi:hypothetical protein
MQDLMDLSSKLKQKAEVLLSNSKILEFLNKHGDTILTGSFSYDLMLSPDIDIYVITSNPELETTSTLNQLIKQRYWNGYLFFDWYNFRSNNHPEFPKSFYIGLKTTDGNYRWKVDIWFLDKNSYDGKENEWITAKLTKENKALILRLKDERNRNADKVSSYKIYDAVMNHGATSLSEIRQ